MSENRISVGQMTGSNIVTGQVSGDVYSAFNLVDSSLMEQKIFEDLVLEVKKFIGELEVSTPSLSDTTTGKMKIATKVIEHLEKDATLAQKIVGALRAGGIKAFEKALNHPAASFVVGALADWEKNKK